MMQQTSEHCIEAVTKCVTASAAACRPNVHHAHSEDVTVSAAAHHAHCEADSFKLLAQRLAGSPCVQQVQQHLLANRVDAAARCVEGVWDRGTIIDGSGGTPAQHKRQHISATGTEICEVVVTSNASSNHMLLAMLENWSAHTGHYL